VLRSGQSNRGAWGRKKQPLYCPRAGASEPSKRHLPHLLRQSFKNRVLDFDSVAATGAAASVVERQQAGRPIDMRDTQVAGIAPAWRATLATRNVRYLGDLHVPVIDPWEHHDR
jgi:predicted nucleic acid-binding protein